MFLKTWLVRRETIFLWEEKLLLSSLLSPTFQFTMSMFHMPSRVVKVLEKLQRDILWEGGNSMKDHLVNWKVVTKVKEQGVLGIGRIKKKNTAL